MKKKKIIDALTKLNELGEVRKKEILKLEKCLEHLKVSRKMPNCYYGWLCKRVICQFDHAFLHSKVNDKAKVPLEEN